MLGEAMSAEFERGSLLDALKRGEVPARRDLDRYFGGTHIKHFTVTVPGMKPIVTKQGFISCFSAYNLRDNLALADLIDGEIVIHPGASQMLVEVDPVTIFKVETTGPELYIRATSSDEAELKAAQHLGMSGIVVSARVATESDLSYAREVGLV